MIINSAKKIVGHIRSLNREDAQASKKEVEAPASKKVAIVHAQGIFPNILPIKVGPRAPICLVVPKKPIMVEDISMDAFSLAYFCMEVGIDNALPTYAGGLGILAGDMLRSCADLEIDTIGVTLLYRGGYFKQHFDASGWQIEEDEDWDPHEKLLLLPGEVKVEIEGRTVRVRAWLFKITGATGKVNPLIFLDTDVEGNTIDDRAITRSLYRGDARIRLMQEAVLGIGGVRMLAQLGATNIQKFHMNEGHSALLTLELYLSSAHCDDPVAEVRQRAVFTTHTPVPAGHDLFDQALVERVLGKEYVPAAIHDLVFAHGVLDMTRIGFAFSQYVNGVAKKHGEVTRELFPGYEIASITNGVHAATWVAEPIAEIYDKYLPDWRSDPYSLRSALAIPAEELWSAHQKAKINLFAYIARDQHIQLDPDRFTICFARRATAYKRGNMLFRDIERLKRIAEKSNGIQIIYAGKAHPADHEGKLLLQQIIQSMHIDSTKITCVYLPNYNIALAKLLVGGADLWLNTPARPQEASGTSGMKAALNGVPHFSVLDGWWLEGHIENVTGWSIGPHPEQGIAHDTENEDADDLYTKLEYVILPRFESDRHSWVKMMRSTAAINGSFFNTQRMVEQYVLGAYFQ